MNIFVSGIGITLINTFVDAYIMLNDLAHCLCYIIKTCTCNTLSMTSKCNKCIMIFNLGKLHGNILRKGKRLSKPK